MSLWLGLIGIILGVAVVDVKGLEWAQRRMSDRIYKAALNRPLVREFPASQHTITLDAEDKLA